MPIKRTAPISFAALTTASTTILTNPANSGEVRTYEIVVVNIDGVADALVNSLAVSGNLILPKNCEVAAGDSVFRRVTLAPGGAVTGQASADGDLIINIQQIWAEAV